MSTAHEDGGLRVRARLDAAAAGRLAEFVVATSPPPRNRRAPGRADLADVRLGRDLMSRIDRAGFVPPPYPYDRLDGSSALAEPRSRRRRRPLGRHALRPAAGRGGRGLATSDSERGYPPSIGTPALRGAASRWLGRRFGVDVPTGTDRRLRRHEGVRGHAAPVAAAAHARPRHRAATRRSPTRPTRWARRWPAAAPCPCRSTRASDLAWTPSTPTTPRAPSCLWVNSPGNPTGALDDLAAAAAWGASPRGAGVQRRVLRRVHLGRRRRARSSSTGSTVWWPSTRCRSARTWPASGSASTPATTSWSQYLKEVRKHVGMLVPGPAQAAGCRALDDDEHVRGPARALPAPARADGGHAAGAGPGGRGPAGGWLLPVGRGRRRLGVRGKLAFEGGALVSPGEFYGPAGPTTFVWPWCSLTTDWTSWPSA